MNQILNTVHSLIFILEKIKEELICWNIENVYKDMEKVIEGMTTFVTQIDEIEEINMQKFLEYLQMLLQSLEKKDIVALLDGIQYNMLVLMKQYEKYLISVQEEGIKRGNQ